MFTSDFQPIIIHAEPSFVVISKPSGMLSVPGKGPDKQDCVALRIAQLFPDATGPLVVHRLDMDTSGLLVLGLTPQAQRALSIQFQDRIVHKQYTALLHGALHHSQGSINLPLRADITNRPIQIVDHQQGKPARTNYHILSRETDRTRVIFEPVTGRTHQLRVHAAAGLDAPILGDVLYGKPDNASRLMLHASTLSFIHPYTQRRLDFTDPPPF